MIPQKQIGLLHTSTRNWHRRPVKYETLRQKRWFRFSHLYIATFQQHLNMEYISLSWYDIPKHDFLDRGLLLTWNHGTKGSWWLSWRHHFKGFTVVTMTWSIGTNIYGYVPLVVITICPFSIPYLSSVCDKSKTVGATCGAWTTYPSEAPGFTRGF